MNDIITNANYIDSAEYVQHGNKAKNVTRYDYFEIPAQINNKNYIVSFDVEVMPGTNNYRIHKVIKEINLTEVSNANANEIQFSTVTGPVPAVSTDSPSLSNNIVPVLKKTVNNMEEGGVSSEDLWNELSQGDTKSQQSTQQIPVLKQFNQQTTGTQQEANYRQRKSVYTLLKILEQIRKGE